MPRISRDTDIYPITMRELEVLGVEDITPGMRRVTFGGEGLLAHERDGEQVPAIVSDGFDDDMRIIFPDPVTGERPYPASLGDGRLDWNAEVNDLFRTYTVRKWSPDAGEYGELVVDFARHGAGLAEDWSSTAVPGGRVYAAGPKNCGSLPVHTDWLLLVGDDTALPAIGRCLEETPAGHRVIAVVEVADRADIQHDLAGVACAETLDLHWVVRAEGGDFTEELLAVAGGGGGLPSGVPFVWAAGESKRLKTVRRFVKEAGVPREHVEITGYWRKNDAVAVDGNESGTGEKEPATSSLAPLMQLHEMAEVAPGFALRAAAGLGIFEAVDTAVEQQGGPVTAAAVAGAVGVDVDILVRFLRYLESVSLVDLSVPDDSTGVGDTTVLLTSLGRELADPDGAVARLTGPDSLRTLAWLHLEQGLRSGRPVDVGATGLDWAGLRARDTAVVDTLADAEATRAQWVAPALAQGLGTVAAAAGPVSTIAVAGAGEGVAAAVYADELLRHDPELAVSVLNLDGGAGGGRTVVAEERLAREVGESRRERFSVQAWTPGAGGADGGSVDLVVLVDPFALAVPQDVPALLSSAASRGRAVVVISRLLAESGDEDHDYEEDITRLLLDGRSVPTRRDLGRAIAEAGLTGVADRPVGWGSHAVVAVPS